MLTSMYLFWGGNSRMGNIVQGFSQVVNFKSISPYFSIYSMSLFSLSLSVSLLSMEYSTFESERV
jgi:formate hydrogenlyase subunit 3/multisubunit Na+/H+ antiporter MnhD subunit